MFTRDQLLANISLYWFTGAIGSSFFPYYFRIHRPWPIPDGGTVAVPTGYCEFPFEMLHPPRSLAARTFTDIQRWTVMPRGGHFAAMEQPDALANKDARSSGRCGGETPLYRVGRLRYTKIGTVARSGRFCSLSRRGDDRGEE